MRRSGCLAINADIGIASPEACLVQMANVLEVVELTGIMHELCGFYSPSSISESGLISRDPLTDAKKLEAVASRLSGTHGIKKFLRALSCLRGPSRSPMETALTLCLSMPKLLGGYGLSGMCLNTKTSLDSFSRKASGIDELEPDILFADQKLCIEYDGKSFHSGRDAVQRDARRGNFLTLNGYDVITIGASQLLHADNMHKTALLIARRLGKRIRIEDMSEFRRRRDILRYLVLSRNSILRNQQVNQNKLMVRRR